MVSDLTVMTMARRKQDSDIPLRRLLGALALTLVRRQTPRLLRIPLHGLLDRPTLTLARPRTSRLHRIPLPWLLGSLALIGMLLSMTNTIGFGIIIGAGFLVIGIRFSDRLSARSSLLVRVEMKTEEKLESLLRRRAQLVRPDPYGKFQFGKWNKEIRYFLDEQVRPSLERRERAALERNYDEVVAVIAEKVETAMRDCPTVTRISDDMTPAEFESFCAEELRRSGWDAHATMQSRDQGVDVVAVKNGRRIVLQCKLYSRPVGNKSVQEITAGRAYEQADFAIVVSNNRYTESAEQLAATNRVLLLHYRDLQNIDDLLNRV